MKFKKYLAYFFTNKIYNLILKIIIVIEKYT